MIFFLFLLAFWWFAFTCIWRFNFTKSITTISILLVIVIALLSCLNLSIPTSTVNTKRRSTTTWVIRFNLAFIGASIPILDIAIIALLSRSDFWITTPGNAFITLRNQIWIITFNADISIFTLWTPKWTIYTSSIWLKVFSSRTINWG